MRSLRLMLLGILALFFTAGADLAANAAPTFMGPSQIAAAKAGPALEKVQVYCGVYGCYRRYRQPYYNQPYYGYRPHYYRPHYYYAPRYRIYRRHIIRHRIIRHRRFYRRHIYRMHHRCYRHFVYRHHHRYLVRRCY
ncbi:MAG: hypothetical protein KGQ46_08070 [Hyphomicrobiales bacterium]|nr:hypothetical protein [Hyphomicrobiales bacterium]MDE2113601.1 hypothetical protein [Hyphomicrobiales bacterium]